VTVIDRDRVEAHNLTRSVLLRESDIGSDKADAVASHARALDPRVTIEAVQGDLHDRLTLSAVRDHDVVIGALDNAEARIRINQVCLLAGVPWVNAAIDARHASVEAFPFGRGRGCACFECALPTSVYERLAARTSCGGLMRAALAEQIMPTTILTTSIAGALAVGEALRLTGRDQRDGSGLADSAARVFVDCLTGRAHRTELARAGLCAGCGDLPSPAQWLGEADSLQTALALFQDPDGGRPYRLSDRVVWSCACNRCGSEPAGGGFVGRRAAALSEAITWCARCGRSSVEVDIRDHALGRELIERFRTRLPDARWLLGDGSVVGLPARVDSPSEPLNRTGAQPS
jgi:molybdopterin/thiamine biosynthesis adenylyltransferase